jgi:hypothetical protein
MNIPQYIKNKFLGSPLKRSGIFITKFPFMLSAPTGRYVYSKMNIPQYIKNKFFMLSTPSEWNIYNKIFLLCSPPQRGGMFIAK